MANRKLYNEKSFVVGSVNEYDNAKVWHLIGRFTDDSIKSIYSDSEYRIRVKADPRWREVIRVAFHADRIYETESIQSVTRKHIYGTGKWYISPYRPKDEYGYAGEFTFEDFDVVLKSDLAKVSTD